jgi:hypothetical protein
VWIGRAIEFIIAVKVGRDGESLVLETGYSFRRGFIRAGVVDCQALGRLIAEVDKRESSSSRRCSSRVSDQINGINRDLVGMLRGESRSPPPATAGSGDGEPGELEARRTLRSHKEALCRT